MVRADAKKAGRHLTMYSWSVVSVLHCRTALSLPPSPARPRGRAGPDARASTLYGDRSKEAMTWDLCMCRRFISFADTSDSAPDHFGADPLAFEAA